MPSEKRKFGDIGEKIAEKWLNNKGFYILERNQLLFILDMIHLCHSYEKQEKPS